jgi:hypothetical protein
LSPGKVIDFDSLDYGVANLSSVTLYEVKSTRRALPADFKGHFFSLSTAELLVAQSVGPAQFRFAFVDAASKRYLDLSLIDIYRRMRGLYPSWSIASEGRFVVAQILGAGADNRVCGYRAT